jgi:hypothetical protein
MRCAATFPLLLAILWTVCAAAAEPRMLDDFEQASGRWTFSNGPEFPGASGSFERAQAAARNGRFGGALAFDFTGGGNYVAAILRTTSAPDIAAVRLWVNKPAGHSLTFRYTDQTGQTHQKTVFCLDDRWCDLIIPIEMFTSHWGGANDGKVNGPPRSIAFLIENGAFRRGRLLIDDLRIIEGRPGSGAGMMQTEYIAARFAPSEGWHLRSGGDRGVSRLDANRLAYDFTRGASFIGIAPAEYSLLGTPSRITLGANGRAAGHPARMQIATHFMMFERQVGQFDENGLLSTHAPPGDGWRWYWGENDGRIHGPLRLRGILLDRADLPDSGQLELLDIRVQTRFPPQRACVLVAELRQTSRQFVATARSLLQAPAEGTLTWTIRDWRGQVLHQSTRPLTIPPGAVPVESTLPIPPGEHVFLEATASLEIPGQMIPDAQACLVGPIESQRDTTLDPDSPMGVGLYLYRYPADPPGLELMDRAARMAADAGVKWSREEFGWSRIERRRGEYDWSFYDNVVATAKRHGIRIYGVLAYWTGWTKPYTPEGIEDYCRFAAAAAERYRDDIQHWEVWNEPNIFFWQGPQDMYADLLRQAYAAIRQANPQAQVLGCSTSGIDTRFIQRTMDLGAPFDILTIHPYRRTMDDLGFVRELRAAAGLVSRPGRSPRPVWITEMGWATHVAHNSIDQSFAVTSQRDQADLLARSYINAIASGAVANMSWYNFRNDGEDPFNFEHNMGIITRDFNPKPAYRALATVTRMLKHKRPGQHPDLGEDIIAWRFESPDGSAPLLTLWAVEEERRATLPPGPWRRMTDLMGQESPLPQAPLTIKPAQVLFITD